MANQTVAGNPGGVEVARGQYFRAYPKPLLGVLVMLVGVGVMFLVNDAQQFSLVIGGAIIVLGYLPMGHTLPLIRQWMAYGNTCPGIVIDDTGSLVAVWSDMSTGHTSQPAPAIKILKLPIKHATGGPFQIGSWIPVVCTYKGSAKADRWEDFTPVPVGCATKDIKVVERKTLSISEEEWKELSDGLSQLPTPLDPGLYFL